MKLALVCCFVTLAVVFIDYSSAVGASASTPAGKASASASKPSASKPSASKPSASKPKAGASVSASKPSAPKPKAGGSVSVSKPSAPTPKAGASGKVPEGYKVTAKTPQFIMAIKLNKNKLSWNDARKACFHEGHDAFLGYANTKEEEKMILKMMTNNKINDLWVGIHDLFESNGDYSTVRGEVAKEAAHFTWYPGEPNSYNGAEPCGEYRIAHGKRGLNDRKCHQKFAYICKVKIPVS